MAKLNNGASKPHLVPFMASSCPEFLKLPRAPTHGVAVEEENPVSIAALLQQQVEGVSAVQVERLLQAEVAR